LRSITRLSESHLSRFLHGERPVDLDSVERIAEEVGMDAGELVSHTHRLPQAVQPSLADPALAYALIGPDHRLPVSTRLVLRRVSIGRLVQETYQEPGRRELPDPTGALGAQGYGIEAGAGAGWDRVHVEIDGAVVRFASLDVPAVRFQLAHALGHIHLGTAGACNLGRTGSDLEVDANSFASYFLVPPRRLEAELGALPTTFDLWDPDGFGALLRDVASALEVPAWLLARRLSEDGHSALLAGVAG
jgi:hypothetical protein